MLTIKNIFEIALIYFPKIPWFHKILSVEKWYSLQDAYLRVSKWPQNHFGPIGLTYFCYTIRSSPPTRRAAERLPHPWAKFAEKVHKPPFWFNVINFELNGIDASIRVPWSPSDPQKSWCTDRSIQIHKKQTALLHLYRVRDAWDLLWGLWTFSSKLAECVPRHLRLVKTLIGKQAVIIFYSGSYCIICPPVAFMKK
jgi:hypothetical protein